MMLAALSCIGLGIAVNTSDMIIEYDLSVSNTGRSVATLQLENCNIETLKAKESENMFEMKVDNQTFMVESIGLFARANGECELKLVIPEQN